jgi:exopolysaccharide biosynthesis polyprenyl glycosylphosphotransferase
VFTRKSSTKRVSRTADGKGRVIVSKRNLSGGAGVLANTLRGERRRSSTTTTDRIALTRVGFAATDLLCFAVATATARVLFLEAGGAPSSLLHTVIALFAWLATFAGFGLYRPDLLSAPEELRRIVSATSVGVVLVIVEGSLFAHPQPKVPILVLWLVATVCELGTRRIWRWYLARRRNAGSLAARAMIVGTDAGAARAGETLAEAGSGFIPIGFVSTASSISGPGEWPSVPSPVVGAIEHLEHLVQRHDADAVFVVSGCVSPDEMLGVYRACRRTQVELRVSANLPETLTSRVTLLDVGGTMALCVRPVALRGANAVLKRAVDIALAAVGLVVLFVPSLLVIAAIRLSSPGPAVFSQDRVTQGGRRFTIFKFRTMRTEGDAFPVDTSTPFFKMTDDPRITKIGAFLRRFSIDEWPQLWNVLIGDMSLVGPRPLPADQVDNITERDVLLERHEVRAGLTGWWQINGRNDVTPEEAFRADAFYVENWSLSLDLYILLKTAGALLRHRGAY